MPGDADAAVLSAAKAKIDRRLMAFLLLMYILAFLDRTNVGFAQQSFQADTGIGDGAYAFGASVFFLGYALLEVPSNLILARVGARLWMARIMVTWGLVSAAMMFVHGETAFYALRLLLGICEAGFFPGVIYYLTRWYPPAARGRAMGLFYFGAPLSFILGGPLSGALLGLDGVAHLAGWQWLFLIDGLAASVVGVVAYFYLDDGPETASWLSAEERAAVARAAPVARIAHGERIGDVLAALRQRRVLHLAMVYLLIQLSVYGVVFFLPAQIAALVGARVGPTVGLVSTLPWLCALVATALAPRWSDRTGRRRATVATLLAIAGIGIAASVATASAIVGLVALAMAASGFIAAQPVFWSIAASLLTGVRAAAAIALINSMGAVGAFLAPNVRVAVDHAAGSAHAGLYALAGLTLLGAALAAAMPEAHAPAAGTAPPSND